jgi:hypothetical protein
MAVRERMRPYDHQRDATIIMALLGLVILLAALL